MQVMPETSLQLGFEEYEEPKDNIHVGAYYLKYLENKFNKFDLDTLEQIKFTLAAYNAGLGHVLDAIRLAESYGKNPKSMGQQRGLFHPPQIPTGDIPGFCRPLRLL